MVPACPSWELALTSWTFKSTVGTDQKSHSTVVHAVVTTSPLGCHMSLAQRAPCPVCPEVPGPRTQGLHSNQEGIHMLCTTGGQGRASCAGGTRCSGQVHGSAQSPGRGEDARGSRNEYMPWAPQPPWGLGVQLPPWGMFLGPSRPCLRPLFFPDVLIPPHPGSFVCQNRWGRETDPDLGASGLHWPALSCGLAGRTNWIASHLSPVFW